MKNIGILVGEDADLPQNVIQYLPIITFPFIVNWQGYGAMRIKNIKYAPTTSQPSVKTLVELFNKNLKIYEELLVITISSYLSGGTYNAALQAKKLLTKHDQDRIHIIDSQTSSGAEGLLVLKVAKQIAMGDSTTKIIKDLNKNIYNTHLLGVFDNPTWLQKGGRINAIQAMLVKNMLKTGFRPILTIRDGKIVTKKIQKLARNKANALFVEFKEEYSGASKVSSHKVTVAITHADCETDANKLKNLIANYNKNITIKFINIISPVVGAHLGPDSLIISWMVG